MATNSPFTLLRDPMILKTVLMFVCRASQYLRTKRGTSTRKTRHRNSMLSELHPTPQNVVSAQHTHNVPPSRDMNPSHALVSAAP